MAIDFNPETFEADFDGFRLTCSCGASSTARLGDTEDDALATPIEQHPRCASSFCAEEPPVVRLYSPLTWPVVNITSLNARPVLDALGYPREIDPDMWGSCEPGDFLGRILMAQAIAPVDEGLEAHQAPGLGAPWIHCGRDAAHLQRTLASLVEVAEWARDHGRLVVWG